MRAKRWSVLTVSFISPHSLLEISLCDKALISPCVKAHASLFIFSDILFRNCALFRLLNAESGIFHFDLDARGDGHKDYLNE